MQLVIPDSVLNLAEFICESDAIAGIKDDFNLVVKQIRSRHWEGHVGAMLMLEKLVQSPLNYGGYVSNELVCSIQGLITAEQHLKSGEEKLDVGHYRPDYLAVSVGGRLCPSSFLVPELMIKLLKGVRWWQANSRFQESDYNIRYLARFHLKFEIIHPFADGNGRTGRALVYYLMRWAGLAPFLFTAKDKHELYYPCFDDIENADLMERYFITKMGTAPADG